MGFGHGWIPNRGVEANGQKEAGSIARRSVDRMCSNCGDLYCKSIRLEALLAQVKTAAFNNLCNLAMCSGPAHFANSERGGGHAHAAAA
jgi:hypothetical protein